MTDSPLLSFIVLSYNYEQYIGITLRSILEQTVPDFEVVVVDDASMDASREVVGGFQDRRIRLLVNEQNMGGAWSYNRAIQAARGEFLVNLDADDWAAPERCARQLDEFSRRPEVDILGTHVTFVDAEGKRHRSAAELEAYTNGGHDLNRIETWVGANRLCRSSTMVRRAAHARIGLDDPAMVRGPDYELWTRALRMGCRFGALPERLTFYRLHDRGVTHADPRGSLFELSHSMLRNLVPMVEERAGYTVLDSILAWVTRADAFAALTPTEQYRLLGMLLASPDVSDFSDFLRLLGSSEEQSALTTAGRRFLANASALRWTAPPPPASVPEIEFRLMQAELTADRDLWRERCLTNERDLAEDRDLWRERCLTNERDLAEDRDRWMVRCLARERELAKAWPRRVASRLMYRATSRPIQRNRSE